MSDVPTNDLFDRLVAIRRALQETDSDRAARVTLTRFVDGIEDARREDAELRRCAEKIFGEVTDEIALFIVEARQGRATA